MPENTDGVTSTHETILRDWFAGQTLVAVGNMDTVPIEQIAKWCYEQADAMMEERKKR